MEPILQDMAFLLEKKKRWITEPISKAHYCS
jgi:hypothetical protein